MANQSKCKGNVNQEESKIYFIVFSRVWLIIQDFYLHLQTNVKNRSIYYVSEAIARQGEKGADWQYKIDAVYLVAFLNFCPMDFDKQFRTDVGLIDRKSGKVFSDKERMTFMQLPLFTKEADECETDFDKWIYVLKNMETLTRLPWAAKSSVFKRLEQIADVASLSRQERMKYDVGLKKYRDTLSVLEGAKQDGLVEGRAQGMAEGRAEGMAEGRAEGRAEGIQNEKAETAKRLSAIGMDINTIAIATGLSAKEIETIIKH